MMLSNMLSASMNFPASSMSSLNAVSLSFKLAFSSMLRSRGSCSSLAGFGQSSKMVPTTPITMVSRDSCNSPFNLEVNHLPTSEAKELRTLLMVSSVSVVGLISWNSTYKQIRIVNNNDKLIKLINSNEQGNSLHPSF